MVLEAFIFRYFQLSPKHNNYRKVIALHVVLTLAFLIFLVFSIVNYTVNLNSIALFDFSLLLITLIIILHLYHYKNIELSSKIVSTMIFLASSGIVILSHGQNFMLFYSFLYPMFSMILLGRRTGLWTTVLLFIIVDIFMYPYIGEVVKFAEFARFVTLSIVITGLLYFYEKTIESVVTMLNRSLSELDDERNYVDSLLNSQENIVVSTDGVKLRSANKAFMDYFGVKSADEFMEKIGNCICDTFNTNAPNGFIQKMMGDEKWIDYVYNRPKQIHKASIIRNGVKSIFTITASEFEFRGEKQKVAVFNNITEIEKIRKNIENILSNIMLPVLITSQKERIILYANSYASKQYEASIDDMIGKNIDEIYTNTTQKDEILGELKVKGYVENLEERYKTFKGKEFTGLLSVQPIFYNGIESYIGMVVDITKQKEIEERIRKINKHTRDSIEYAALIQGALIPENEILIKYFKDYFTIWEPKDIVGGDIYLFEELRDGDECLIMMVDCTGHGVPGAFVPMLVKPIERQVLAKIENDRSSDVSPPWILSYFNKTMKKLLHQESVESISNAGFDGGIIYYNKKEKIIKYAGAEMPLFYIDESNVLQMIRGDRHSIGYKKSDINHQFKEYIMEAKEGIRLYLTTDGYIDQNGGEKGFPFSKRQFARIIQDNCQKPFAEQKEQLINALNQYQKDEDRNDDVTVIGFSI